MKNLHFCRNHYAGGTEYCILIGRSWTLKASAICACIGILGLIWLLTSCAPLTGYTQRELFNEEHYQWRTSTLPTRQNIDTVITLRVRAFGDKIVKQLIFQRDYPHLGIVDQGAVSSKIPEIWMDIRENEAGEIVPGAHILGHEMIHVLKLHGINVYDPDKTE